MTDIYQRFWSKVDKSGECWMWTACKTADGYGRFCQKKAHRVSWEMENGPIPEGMQICHHCDTPGCVRPSHLFVGTKSDNARDMANKGRCYYQIHPELRRGENSATAKLKAEHVQYIRKVLKWASRPSYKTIGSWYGVSAALICRIYKGRAWAHLPQPEEECV